MAIEQGIVIKANGPAPTTARVKTVQPSACESCSSRHNCRPGAGKEREVDAINVVNAKPGDLIQISMDTTALLKATFMLYMFPIICMLIGGIVGNSLAGRLGMNTSLSSAIAAIGSFTVAMWLVRIRAGRMARQMEYRPKITRILSKSGATGSATPNACENQTAGSI